MNTPEAVISSTTRRRKKPNDGEDYHPKRLAGGMISCSGSFCQGTHRHTPIVLSIHHVRVLLRSFS